MAVAQQAADGRLGRLDRAALTALQARQRPARIVTGARMVSALAEPGILSALMAAGYLAAPRRVSWGDAGMACVSVAGGAAIRRLLSVAIARPRPPANGWLTEPEGFSLPSKHATLAALAVGAWLRRIGTPGPFGALASFTAAAGIGASRIYLGVHWPSDILSAWLFAEAWLRLGDARVARVYTKQLDLAPATTRAIAVADSQCRQSPSCGDTAAFTRQPQVAAHLRQFATCALLMTDG
jgi:membrane-associated phospholipid phosphatase